MGTIAQEILRKAHGIEQRQSIKSEVDSAEAKVKGTEVKSKVAATGDLKVVHDKTDQTGTWKNSKEA
jgi:hypothetical protein